MKRTLVVGGLACVVALVTYVLITPAAAQPRGVFPGNPAGVAPPADSLVELSDQLEAVTHRVLPAVVSVQAVKQMAVGKGPAKTVEETGSGVIVKLDGWGEHFFVTNNHVIKETPLSQITIVLHNGRILRPTRIWADKETDVAFMMVDGAKGLQAATLGNSDNVRPGRLVLAMGNPYGLGWSVSHGIVSARDRGHVNLGNQIRLKEFLQTDAAINPGSSGGPLVDVRGEVIGINTAIASPSGSNTGVAFCIPINMVKRVMTQLLRQNGTIQRGYLGAKLATILEPQEALRLGRDNVTGALVELVFPNTPAAVAGIRPADIILALDNTLIRNENQFINQVSGLPPGQRIRLQIWRNNAPITLEATVGAWNKGP